MPKTQTKPGLSPRELDALRRQYLAEQKQRESANKWQLANDIVSGINDIVGRGVIAPILGIPGDINQAIHDAGAWVNNKIKDVEVATGMVKQPRYVQPSQGNAYLGSEDIGNRMERAGLVSPKRRPKTELAASLVSPSSAAKTAINAPKTAVNMLRMVDNLEAPSRGVRTADGMYIPRGQMGAIENLWHGSPHTFDRFDLSKMGTGEGAQAYGYGAYLAESKGVGESYKASTSRPEIEVRGEVYKADDSGVFRGADGNTASNLPDYLYSAMNGIIGSKPDISNAQLAEEVESFLQTRRGVRQSDIEKAKSAIINGEIVRRDTGNLYQTRLAWPDAAREATDPLSPENFLDWDKPLSEQPDIIAKLSPEIRSRIASAIDSYGNNKVTGQYLVDVAMLDDAASAGVPREQATKYVANKLSELGIPGSRYLDAGSRPTNIVDKELYALYEKYGDVNKAVDEMMKGVYNTPKVKQQMRDGYIKQLNTQKQTSNYVVFDDKLIDIVSRNNQPIKK